MAKLRSLILIVETDDGKCYQAALSDRQETAIRSVINALSEPFKVIDTVLGMTIDHKDKK